MKTRTKMVSWTTKESDALLVAWKQFSGKQITEEQLSGLFKNRSLAAITNKFYTLKRYGYYRNRQTVPPDLKRQIWMVEGDRIVTYQEL